MSRETCNFCDAPMPGEHHSWCVFRPFLDIEDGADKGGSVSREQRDGLRAAIKSDLRAEGFSEAEAEGAATHLAGEQRDEPEPFGYMVEYQSSDGRWRLGSSFYLAEAFSDYPLSEHSRPVPLYRVPRDPDREAAVRLARRIKDRLPDFPGIPWLVEVHRVVDAALDTGGSGDG